MEYLEPLIAGSRDVGVGLGRWIATSAVGGALAVAAGTGTRLLLASFLPQLGPDAGVGEFGGVAAVRFFSIVLATLASGAVCGAAYRALLGAGRGAWPTWVALGCVGSLLYTLVVMLVFPTFGPGVPQTAARTGLQVVYCAWMSLFLWFSTAGKRAAVGSEV
jgi:hypothetical protein